MDNEKIKLAHAIDLFLHKDRTSYFDSDATESVTSQETTTFSPVPPSFHWDLQKKSKPMLPAFQYISHKLYEKEVSVPLIISDHEPYVIPVWPLPRKSQLILAKIIRKVVKKFALEPSWLTAVASVPNKGLPKVFEAYQPDSYIVRRSIVQNDIIFSDEGLTLLSIDKIYIFKQLLCFLSKPDWVEKSRDVCLSSCIHLYQQINEIYTDPKVSKGYLERVYKEVDFKEEAFEQVTSTIKEVDFKEEAFEQVTSTISTNYCTASIRDVTMLEPDFTAMTEIALDFDSDDDEGAAELPDTSTTLDHSSHSDQISNATETIDLSTLDSWETEPPPTTPTPSPPERPRYPLVRRPSSVRESLIDPMAPWSFPLPPPLRTLRSRRTIDRLNAEPPLPASAPLLNAERRVSDNGPRSPSARPLDSWTASEVMQSPLRWLDSWSTDAPSPLCRNCHNTLNVDTERRFTFA